MSQYKIAKTIDEQIEYLKTNKRVKFNIIDEKEAKKILFRYNYINVISPFKHHFAKLNNKKEVVKVNGNHVYERDVEFSEYYALYKKERRLYPEIATNVMYFESQFNSILSYRVLTTNTIRNTEDLKAFLESIKANTPNNSKYNEDRLQNINKQIDSLLGTVEKYHDVYCFFDRLTLGNLLTIFCGLDKNIQKQILDDCKELDINFGVNNVNAFIKKYFTLVAIRNCVMHSNSLEILVRFYNPKTKDLRKATDKKKYTNMIKMLSKRKTLFKE